MNARRFDYRYCQQCLKTTRHAIRGISYVCPVCNSLKRPRHVVPIERLPERQQQRLTG